MRIFLIRHAESIGNTAAGHIIQGRNADSRLTTRGALQARRLAARLARRHRLAAVWSSPAGRALATARLLSARSGAPVRVHPGLAEIDNGSAAGLTPSEFAARYPAHWARLESGEGLSYRWPDGESGYELRARAVSTLADLLARCRDQPGPLAVVTHHGPLAFMLAHLLGEEGDDWPPYRLANCAVVEVVIAPAGLRLRCSGVAGLEAPPRVWLPGRIGM